MPGTFVILAMVLIASALIFIRKPGQKERRLREAQPSPFS